METHSLKLEKLADEMFESQPFRMRGNKESYIKGYVDSYYDAFKASQSKLPVDNGEELYEFLHWYAGDENDSDERNGELRSLVKLYLNDAPSQSKLTGTVFVEVNCSDGKNVPDDDTWYYVVMDSRQFGGKKNEMSISYYRDGMWGGKNLKVTSWLRPTAAPKLYSEEQMRKCFEAGRMSFAFECGDEFEEDEKPFNNVDDYINSL